MFAIIHGLNFTYIYVIYNACLLQNDPTRFSSMQYWHTHIKGTERRPYLSMAMEHLRLREATSIVNDCDDLFRWFLTSTNMSDSHINWITAMKSMVQNANPWKSKIEFSNLIIMTTIYNKHVIGTVVSLHSNSVKYIGYWCNTRNLWAQCRRWQSVENNDWYPKNQIRNWHGWGILNIEIRRKSILVYIMKSGLK